MWNLVLVHLKTVLVPVQDSCTVWAQSFIGSEIVYVHPVVPLGDKAQVEPRFDPFGDYANLDAR
jgi:hypothetical protein